MIRPSLLVLLLVGCATQSPVVPYGNGTYIVNGEDIWGTSTAGSLKVKVAQTANDHCAKQGKVMKVENSEGKGNVWTGASASLVFSCADKP